MARRIVVWTILVLVCIATAALAGDAGPAEGVPIGAGIPQLTAQQRFANVQQSMQENGIGFQPQVALGDDGRLLVSVVPIDLFATR